MTAILCQVNSLLQKNNYFIKPTITFKELVIVCMPFTPSCRQNEHFPANRIYVFQDILLIWSNFLPITDFLAKILLISDFLA